MNAQPENLPAERKPQPPLAKLATQLDQRADEFRKALPAHISPEKMQRTIITAVQNNPDLLNADRQSLVTSCMKAAQDGLLPDGREAALVVFRTRQKDMHGNWETVQQVQYMPMVYGLRKKIVQSGEVVSLQTGLVYRAEMEAGAFLYEVGLEPPIRHRPMLDLPAEEMTDDKIVAAYSMAKMKDGTVSVEVMRRGEIDKVRESSMTGATKDRNGKDRQPKGPWVDWFGEMARKTVMRRHSKTLPMSGDVIVDVEGREQEIASRAAQLLDSTEPDAPAALPRREDFDDQGETVDGETGEVMQEGRDPATGMTEVDEETARRLDAGETEEEEPEESETEPEQAEDATPEPEQQKAAEPDPEPAAEKGQGEQPKGDGGKEPLYKRMERLSKQGQGDKQQSADETVNAIDGQLEQDGGDKPTWAGAKDAAIEAFANAKTNADLKKADDEYIKHRGAMPDEVVKEIDAAMREAKARVAENRPD